MRNHGGVAIWPAWATGAVEVCPADPQWQWLGEGWPTSWMWPSPAGSLLQWNTSGRRPYPAGQPSRSWTSKLASPTSTAPR